MQKDKVGSHQSATKRLRHKMDRNKLTAKHAKSQYETKSRTVAEGLLFLCPIDSIDSIDLNRLDIISSLLDPKAIFSEEPTFHWSGKHGLYQSNAHILNEGFLHQFWVLRPETYGGFLK